MKNDIYDTTTEIWKKKYKFKGSESCPEDKTIEDTWKRIAKGLSVNEKDNNVWEAKFYTLLEDFKFLPGGRIIANAGTNLSSTTFMNCLSEDTEFITNEGTRSFKEFNHGDEVTVLTHKGNWKKAVVKSYGEQYLNRITIQRKKAKYQVYATDNHRWITKQGEFIDNLSENTILLAAPRMFNLFDFDDAKPLEKLYWAYGFILGDGSVCRNKQGEAKYSILRLCGHKTKFLYRFQQLGFHDFPKRSIKGDIFLSTSKYIKTHPDIKIDKVTLTRAFVTGYLDADGFRGGRKHTNMTSAFFGIQASKKSDIDFITEIFPTVGQYIVSKKNMSHITTNFGTYKKDTTLFRLMERVNYKRGDEFKVTKIEKDVKKEKVWCLEVEDDHSFVFPFGLCTGNCFVLGIDDSMENIFDTVKNAALTQKAGGGIGFDFSKIRPNGATISGCGSPASGPVSFMKVFNTMAQTIMSAGERRGAQIGILRCDHPDIEEFIDAKRDGQSLTMFNLSVGITDNFIHAVLSDSDWELVFNGKAYKTIKASYLWNKIMQSTYDHAEPGVLFLDHMNHYNNLDYLEHNNLAVNPCGLKKAHHSSNIMNAIV